jgi:lauroyl/myristoyl acyltransferase
LGAEVGFPVGPARLARRLDVPLLALTLRRISGEPRYELFSQPIAAGEDRSEDSLTQCVADALAGAVREQPESWLWMAGKQNAGLQKNQGTR